MIVNIEVTQKIINKSRRIIKLNKVKHSVACPIALAVNSVLNKRFQSKVGSYSVYFISNQENTKYISLPKAAYIFINDFDSGAKVKPFEFKLNFRKELLKPM